MSAPERAGAPATVAAHWEELVTAALLGTDRRDPPPPPPGPLGDLVADTVRTDPSSRMLAQVAACVAVRRAGVRPAPPLDPVVAPVADPRPTCSPAAAGRWRHVVASWPVLEDEWVLTLIGLGGRVRPEILPPMLARHRRDPIRHARAMVAGGTLATWLVERCPELGRRNGTVPFEGLGELPPLPIPPDLERLLAAPGAEVGAALGAGLGDGSLGRPHRAVLVNLVARLPVAGLDDLARVLRSLDPHAAGAEIAQALGDLAATRARMLDELAMGISPSD